MGINNQFNKNSNPYSTSNLSIKELYNRLEEYYDNEDLYTAVQLSSYHHGGFLESIRPLKTAVNRSVEFYVSRLCQDEISITAKNQATKDAIEQFLKWSNFESKKRPYIRSLALFGDLFLKVVSTSSKVYSDMVDPRYVTEFTVDNRGYIQEIRIDVPMRDDNDQPYTYTEYWTKEYFATWNHRYSDTTPLEQLGDPSQYLWLEQLGIDFVPIVWIPFKQVSGKERGESCVSHAILKIDEVNRITTRLHQMLWRYNKPTWAVSANSVDKSGRPLPPPKVNGKPISEENDLDMLKNEVIYLPGMSTMSSLIPAIDYSAALEIIKAMEEELEKDLPELRYNSLKESDMSGKAMRTLLAPAIDKANEAKSNLVAGLTRLNEMALTVGKFMGIFSNLGTYENGDFEHGINMAEVFSTSTDETSVTLKALTDAGIPLEVAMKVVGFDEETIAEAVRIKSIQEDKALGTFLSDFNKQ